MVVGAGFEPTFQDFQSRRLPLAEPTLFNYSLLILVFTLIFLKCEMYTDALDYLGRATTDLVDKNNKLEEENDKLKEELETIKKYLNINVNININKE